MQPGVVWDGCYEYKITNPPTVNISTVQSDGSSLNVTTEVDHGFEVGDVVTIALTGDYDGTYEIENDTGFSANTFIVQPETSLPTGTTVVEQLE